MSENLKNRSTSSQTNPKTNGSKNNEKKNLTSFSSNENFFVKHFQNYMTELGGGPKLFKLRHIINFQKGATFLFVLFLMKHYNNYSLGAFLYLALHGSYGFLWVLKDYVFGDKNFDKPASIVAILGCFLLLGAYWYIPFMQISGQGINNPSNYRVLTAVLMYIFGVNIMLVADCQKHFTLKYKKGLISEGMFYRNRNPNYFGEILLYASFAVLVGKWTPWIILGLIWSIVFNMNMYLKDEASLKKKEGWDEYSKRSGKLLFKFFKSDILHYLMYGGLAGLGWYTYNRLPN